MLGQVEGYNIRTINDKFVQCVNLTKTTTQLDGL